MYKLSIHLNTTTTSLISFINSFSCFPFTYILPLFYFQIFYFQLFLCSLFEQSLPQTLDLLFRWMEVCEDLVWPWGSYAQFPVGCSESAAGKRPAGHEELHAEATCPSEQPVQRDTAMQRQPCWGISRIIGITIRLKAFLPNKKHSGVLQCLTTVVRMPQEHVHPVRFPRKCIVFCFFSQMHKHLASVIINCHSLPFPSFLFILHCSFLF